MSRSKFKVGKGLAQVITTGEPVFVKELDNEAATVVRAIVTPEGIVHREELFPVEQLETRFENAKRGVELEAYIMGLRREAEQKQFAMPDKMKAVLEQYKQNKNGKQLIVEG